MTGREDERLAPPSVSWDEALAGALAASADTPMNERLIEARFGRFAVGGGYYWALRFIHEVGPQIESIALATPENPIRRMQTIITVWRQAIERVAAEDAAGDES